MIGAVICLGLKADVKYVVTLGFGTGVQAPHATPRRLLVLGVGH